MSLQTISDISRKYGVSTRMLRYYEQSGLIASLKKDGYSYRVYDEPAVKRLQQVIILRKLQIPVKQISAILNNHDAAALVEIFRKNIDDLDGEITALSTIRRILSDFVSELEAAAHLNLNLNFLNGDTVLEMTGPLSLIQKNTKGRATMSELNQAAEVLSKREFMGVRAELAFNGNCAQALALYDKAFETKTEVLRYKDALPEDGSQYSKEIEELVCHATLMLGNRGIGMGDMISGEKRIFGNGMSIHVGFSSVDALKTAFDVLKEGGMVGREPVEVFWSQCFCELKDKYGVNWVLSCE